MKTILVCVVLLASVTLVAQSCSDTMLASTTADIVTQIVDDGTYIYFGDDSGRLMRVPKAGGTTQVLATIPQSGTIGIGGIYVDSGNVYFTSNAKPGPSQSPTPGNGNVWMVPAAGGTPVNLASGLSLAFQIKGDATNLYVAVGGSYLVLDAQILAINRATGARQVLAAGLPTLLSLDIDANNVYFGQFPVLGGTAGPAKVSKTGGAVTNINTSKPAYYVALDTTGNILYTSGTELGVYKANIASGALTTLASGLPIGPTGILAVNGNAVYSVDGNCGAGVGTGGVFNYVGENGGASTLFKSSSCASFFTVDSTAMYASVRPSLNAGQIWKYCLPAALTTSGGGTGAPTVNAGGTVNGGSFTTSLAAAGITSVFGTNFASSAISATTLPLPTSLGGVSVKLNGILAPLFFVGTQQINFQIPWELLGMTQASLTVTTSAGTSAAQTVNLGVVAPGIFTINSSGSGQGAIQLANTATFAAPAGSIPGANAQPVSRGNYVTIYCSGLGAVSNQPQSGAAAGSTSTTNATATVTIGGVNAPVSFSGLAPGFVGLYQVNAQVSTSVTPGSAVSLVLSISGVQSNSVTIAVQ
jgi:uncharacterized protein (TIGR03437 family)